MEREVRVLIADDHPIFRRGLRRIIESEPQLKVVFEAADGEQALQWLQGARADIAVLDLTMPIKDGFAVARAVREQGLAVPVVLLTMHKDEHYLNAALDLGVQGYVVKDSATTEIIHCIQVVTAGQEYVSPTLSSLLIRRSRSAAALAQQKPALAQLTPTERRILKLIAEGQTSREIAALLHIGVRTVEHHRNNIALKLELRGSHALLKFAVQHQSNWCETQEHRAIHCRLHARNHVLGFRRQRPVDRREARVRALPAGALAGTGRAAAEYRARDHEDARRLSVAGDL